MSKEAIKYVITSYSIHYTKLYETIEKAAETAEPQTLEERLAAITPEKKYTGEKIALDFILCL